MRLILGVAALVSAVSLGGCASAVAKPPALDQPGVAKCGVTKSHGKPLIVEWPGQGTNEQQGGGVWRGMKLLGLGGGRVDSRLACAAAAQRELSGHALRCVSRWACRPHGWRRAVTHGRESMRREMEGACHREFTMR